MQSESPELINKIQLKIGGMQCSFCTKTIKSGLKRLNGVLDVNVSLAHEEVLVKYNSDIITSNEIKETLNKLGFIVRDPEKVRSFEEEELELRHERNRLIFVGVLTLISLGFMISMWSGLQIPWMRWVMIGLSFITMFGPGWYIKRLALASLRRGILNQHVLLEFAAFGGLVGGFVGFFMQSWPIADFFAVSVFVTAYHILSSYVSLLVRTRSSQAIKKLMALQPATAKVMRPEGELELKIEDIIVGDLVRIRSGESIPVDGIVKEGFSTVDQSLVTGESMPIEKKPEDEVIGGSINQKGTLIITVSHIGNESFLQKIAQHIREARALKPGIVILVDRVLKYFVRGVLYAASLAFIIWTIGPLLINGQPDFEKAIYTTLAVLVMGYPCALGMATPLAIIRGGGIAAQKGILMRTGEAFQVFKDVRKVLLDKTGTITKGKPQIVEVIPSEDYFKKVLLILAASVEVGSEHPLGLVIVEYALDNNLKLMQTRDFLTIPGRGVRAFIDDKIIRVGNSRFIIEEGIIIEGIKEQLKSLENRGLTVIIVSENNNLIGLIAIGDIIKDDALETVKRLNEAGLEPIMITGDNWYTTRSIANQINISKIFAEVSPQEKVKKVRDLQSEGYRVAMVGDGINDAPALMQADVGIAIGAGSDIAIESADVVLIGEQLDGVVEAYSIGKSSYLKTVQNILLAFIFNGIGIPLSVMGILHPIWAMIAMVASVSTILLNSFVGRIFVNNFKKNKLEKINYNKNYK